MFRTMIFLSHLNKFQCDPIINAFAIPPFTVCIRALIYCCYTRLLKSADNE